ISLSEPGGSPRRSRSAADLAGPNGHAGNNGSSAAAKPCFHAVPPSDPLRQANRLPIKVLKMLTARTGHILHPEYLQPLPSTPVSPIELDAKKSPLALLAQTCSQIGKPDPSPSSKLSSKSGFRVPSATCQPFTPRTGSPNSSSGSSGSEGGPGTTSISHSRISVSCAGINVEVNQHQESTPGSKPIASDSASSCSSTTATSSTSVLGSGLVAPVSPYKPGQTVFPLPPAGMSYPGTLAGAYAGYPPQFLPHGVALDPTKSSSLVGAQLAAASSLGCSKPAGSSPLAGASPPSVMTASLCRDPYCLSYHCASHLAGAAGASCAHDQALKSGYPLVYPTHPLHSVHSSLTGATPPSLAGHPLYPYGFMLPNDPQPHICNWVSANGPCDKRFATSEELLSHLRTHTAFPGTDKLLSSYPSSSSLASAAAAAMACHMHIPTTGAPGSPGTLALRSPHHALGLGSRYHPYSKSPLPTPGGPVPVPAATGPYYSPYALYGQRLTTASALGYQ
uniref:Zinc finger protein 503 n=1 Tax=Serinus canaria TaxID=9135 RepID=A0A8C9MGS5_SERCA